MAIDAATANEFDGTMQYPTLSRRLRKPVLTLGLTAALLGACTPGTDPDGATSQGGDNSSNSNSSSSSGFGNNSADGGGGQGAGFGTGGGNTGGGCAGVTNTAEKVPLDIFVMLDKSGSMTDAASGGGTKWDAAVSALTTFVNQPESAGIGVGIQYFPQPSGNSCSVTMCGTDADCGAGCGPCIGFPGFGICQGFANNDSCEPGDYATPAVEIGLLPGNANALISSMNGENPDGAGTPTHPALDGAIDHATEWALSHPGHVVVALLATDGDPTSCETDLSAINSVAASGANATPKINTFVIGVGGSVNTLNGIAAAGGTTDAFMIDSEPDVQQAFLDALAEIQGQALPCSYLIPQPPPGEEINFGKINVSYTPGGGSEQVIPYVESVSACPASGLAWYYDNPAMPTQILLCPNTCSTISQDPDGEVQIVVGCDTVVE